jgi:hypothetical protein
MATDTETVLGFVTKHYADLKTQAEKDNNLVNENITRVIGLIDDLFNTINKDDAAHDEIVKQLREIKKQYNALDLDDKKYTRYKEADKNLNTIMTGLEEVEAELEPASGTASGPASTESGSTASGSEPVESASAPASRELALVPASKALASASKALVPASTELALVPASASGSESRELLPA